MGIDAILIIVLLLLVIIVVAPSLDFRLRLWLRARRDYLNSRGTAHLKCLRHCLRSLNHVIAETQNRRDVLIRNIYRLESELQEALKRACVAHVVDEELQEVRGIGPVLKERIIEHCFDGTLESLQNAWRIRGVGETRIQAIREWILDASQRLPSILREDFPEKKQLIRKYSEDRSSLASQVQELEQRIAALSEPARKASAEVNRLSVVGIRTFYAAYKGNTDASRKVSAYLSGIFPEWERDPDWFKSLIAEYGQGL
jgi:BMFP domain-containing protein YqiC